MRMPNPYWSMRYSSSRREHRHRCVCCNRIVQEGDTVLMARAAKGTKVLHKQCAPLPYGTEGFTHRDGLEASGMAFLAAAGWEQAKIFVSSDPIFRPGGKPADRKR